MDLNCLNNIITNDLAINIDLTNLNSWDLNSGLTSYSLTKWADAKSDNITLYDFGLTAFDNGRTDKMWSGITLTPSDTYFSMYRVGYNLVSNPTTGETSGVTVNTEFLPISGITSGTSGNYFQLSGGYLQGFFKLDGYDYELFPSRYNNGITIETTLYQDINSYGIFYMMGVRAEDKYNPFFTGETTTGGTGGKITSISGVKTSENNYLDAIESEETVKSAFGSYENRLEYINNQVSPTGNTTNNVISFEITQDKKIAYKCVDENGLIKMNESPQTINTLTGWTIISITFTPYEIFKDLDLLKCGGQRLGNLRFYVNGRLHWTVKDFPEFYFKRINNNKEKQIGVPYSISWGGGSFGLKNSWHYQKQTYGLYNGEDQTYVDQKFVAESNPIEEDDNEFPIGTILDGISLSSDDVTFSGDSITAMKIEYTGGTTGTTGQTGTSANTYFIKFNQPVTVLSNRNYEINLNIFDDGFLRSVDENDNIVTNNISLVVYGSEDVNTVSDIQYKYPLTTEIMQTLLHNSNIFDDEYQYVKDGISYFGETGLPVYSDSDYYAFYGTNPITNSKINSYTVTGQNMWLPLKSVFNIKENTGKQTVYVGILIQTNDNFNENSPLFVSNFTYRGADILEKDTTKQNLLIEQNFDSYFNGGIQKLRIYTNGLTSQEILHNALVEKQNNSNLRINKGGRLIYR